MNNLLLTSDAKCDMGSGHHIPHSIVRLHSTGIDSYCPNNMSFYSLTLNIWRTNLPCSLRESMVSMLDFLFWIWLVTRGFGSFNFELIKDISTLMRRWTDQGYTYETRKILVFLCPSERIDFIIDVSKVKHPSGYEIESRGTPKECRSRGLGNPQISVTKCEDQHRRHHLKATMQMATLLAHIETVSSGWALWSTLKRWTPLIQLLGIQGRWLSS
jgi:hypothetical protein